jgi:hypothetical protein
MITRLKTEFCKLNAREQKILMVTVLLLAVWLPYEFWDSSGSTAPQQSWSRISDLSRLSDSLERYRRLKARVSEIEENYARSEFSTEQVYTEVEKIVKSSIGDGQYELRPSASPVELSASVEQQLFTLRLKSLDLDQLVTLLYRLEQGSAPLFLGKLEVAKSQQQGMFSVVIELSSLRRKRTV